MARVAVQRAEPAVRTYEIGLDGDAVEFVERVAPTAWVMSRPTCTVLWHQIQDREELDAMVEALQALGIAPLEVYEAAGATRRRQRGLRALDAGSSGSADRPESSYCEVRVDGRLGESLLSHLRWSHRVVVTTVVRVRATQEAVHALLAELAPAGRLDYLVSG